MTVLTEARHAGEFIVSEANGWRSRESVIVAAGQDLEAGTILGKRIKGTAAAVADGANSGDGVIGAVVPGALAQVGAYAVVCVGGTYAVAAPAAAAGNAGDGVLTLADPAFGADVKVGTYRVTCIEPAADGGTFAVEDPEGIEVGVAHVGVAHDGDHLKFTIADGATDFVAGDTFTIAVSAAVAADGGEFAVTAPDGAAVGTATVGVAFESNHLGFTITDGDIDFAVGDAFTITVAAGSGQYAAFDPAAVDGTAVAAGILWAAVDATDAARPGVAIVRDAEINGEEIGWPEGISAGDKAAAIADLASLGIIVR